MTDQVAAYFRDKRVLITGAASGIGAELAKEMLEAGATVRISDWNRERTEEAAKKLSAFGERVSFDLADVSSQEQVDAMVEKMAADYDGFDMIVNNAGIFDQQPVEEIPMERFKKVLDINLWGVLYGCYAALPIFLAQGHGHIVNTASLGAIVHGPFQAAYGMSKSAVLGFSEALRFEMELRNIDVSTVCPGNVQSGLFLNSLEITRPVLHQVISGRPEAKTITGNTEAGDDFSTTAGNAGRTYASAPFACREIMEGLAEKRPVILTPREFLREQYEMEKVYAYYFDLAGQEKPRATAKKLRENVVKSGNVLGYAEINAIKE